MDWSDELIGLVASSGRIAKHAHVPMQSGSDAVLRRMHRKYRPWHYREKVLKIRAAMPTAAIGADVMVGFPGETEAEFDETRRMVEELPLTYLHVFHLLGASGDASGGAARSRFPGPWLGKEIARCGKSHPRKKAAFMQSLVGTVVEAITLQTSGADFTEALTDNYLKMKISGCHAPNHWMDVKVEAANGETLVGCSQPGWKGGGSRCVRLSTSDSGVHGSEQTN